jgi:hypothetical protein
MYSVSRRLESFAAALTLVVIVGVIAFVTAAQAGTWTLYTCEAPNGAILNEYAGWTSQMIGSAGPNSGAGSECGKPGGYLFAESSSASLQNTYTGWQWDFQAPTGSTIVGGTLAIQLNSPEGQAWVEDPENIHTGTDVLANCQYNLTCTDESRTTVYLPANESTHVYIGAECASTLQSSPAYCQPGTSGNPAIDAQAVLYAAAIKLGNNSVPNASDVGGGLLSANTNGTQNLTFTASDPGGPGVYDVSVSIDNTTIYSGTPADDKSSCTNYGQTTDGTLAFLSTAPCSSSLAVDLPVDTASLADGSHSLKILVEDAAENKATVYEGTITTDNAPTVTSEPTIAGTAQVGSTLTGTDAVFAARSGTGALTQDTDQWLKCSGSGSGCSAIAGATSNTYTPVAADHGYTIEHENTVEDGAKHKASATSAPTVPVAEPSSCTGSGCQTGGGGNGGTGGTGGGGTGGSGGSGGSPGSDSSGTSTPVIVDVMPNGSNLGSVLLGSAARWSITLHVTPRNVRRHTKVKLAGLVSTSPRPAEGKLVYLQARSLATVYKGSGRRRHRVNVYGKWTSFQIFRAKSNGVFSSTYTFRLGGNHTYQFRAVAPAEGQYRNPTGSSATTTVKET